MTWFCVEHVTSILENLAVIDGNTKADAKAIDFDDSFIYDQLDLGYDQRSIRCEHFLRDEAQKAFRKWQEKSDKIPY